MTTGVRRTPLVLAVVASFITGVLVCVMQPATSVPAASTATQIKSLQKQVASLTRQVKTLQKTKADGTDLSTVASGVQVAITSVQAVTGASSQLQVGMTALQASVNGVTTVLDLKANASEVLLKADKETVNALAAKVAALCAAKPGVCTPGTP